MAILTAVDALPQRATVTILFAEARGFARTAETLEPSVVLARASEFLGLIAAAVEHHKGTVINVLNNTLTATFSGASGARHAVCAAQEIRRDFTILKAAWQRDHGIRAEVAMGLHGGAAVIGAGGPIPDQVHVVGDSVSIAGLLLHRARAGEFVVSKTIIDALAACEYPLDARELPPFSSLPRGAMRIFGVLLDTRLDFT